MKFFKGCLVVIFLFLIAAVLGLGYLGFIPGVSSLFGSDKPRNLGIAYIEADRISARGKSKIEYGELPSNVAPEVSIVLSGSREVKLELSSAEVLALMNNRPWKNYPYRDIQVKLNGDGSAEISGVFLKDKLAAYGAYLGAPKEAIDFAAKYLLANPVFYVKAKAALTDNKVSVFEPTAFELGRMPLPVSAFLAFRPSLVGRAYAQSTDMIAELSKVENKRAFIVSFINQRLSRMTGFFAKSAYIAENKLVFDGTLPEKESTAR